MFRSLGFVFQTHWQRGLIALRVFPHPAWWRIGSGGVSWPFGGWRTVLTNGFQFGPVLLDWRFTRWCNWKAEYIKQPEKEDWFKQNMKEAHQNTSFPNRGEE